MFLRHCRGAGTYNMKRLALAVLLLTVLLVVVLLLMPPEKHLGRLLTVIYLHGALIRAGALLFLLGGVAGMVALITGDERAWRWTTALQITSWSTWTLGFVVSFYPSYVTWGSAIVWSEPRTRMVVQVALVSAFLFLLARWLEERVWVAVSSIVVGVTLPLLLWRTGVIRHPLDPVGTSPSTALRLSYLTVLSIVILLGLTVTAWVVERTHVKRVPTST